MALFRTNCFSSKCIFDAQLFGSAMKAISTFPETMTNNIPQSKRLSVSQFRKKTACVCPHSHCSTFNFVASKDINVVTRRYIHSDVRFPSFEDSRRVDTIDPTVPARDTEDARRSAAPGVFYGIGGMFGLIAAKEMVQKIVAYKWIPADQRALAAIEINLSEISEGEVKAYEWRGKPVFVAHRTAEDIARERSTPMNELRDPERDEDRVQKDEWLVIVGVCTHLGCVPIPNEGEYKGGYFCPCHGSHYDASGRIRKGPAPTNMEVPEHIFNGDTLVVGGK